MAALSVIEFEPQQLLHDCENAWDDYFLTADNYELKLEEPQRNGEEELHEESKQFEIKEEYYPCNEIQFEEECAHDPQDEDSVVLIQNVVHDEDYWTREVDQPMQDEVILEPDNNYYHNEQNNYLDPETFLDFNQQQPAKEVDCFNCKAPHQEPLASPAPSYGESTRAPTVTTYDQDLQDLEDLKEFEHPAKKVSTKQDGTLAFLRQCILELKAGIDLMFAPHEMAMKKALWDYMLRIAKKTEIQKQPKKKIKYLFIPCLDATNVFEGLNLEMSNVVRTRCYYYIRAKVDSKQFESNFLKHRNYGKIDKKGRELDRSVAENKIVNTLQQYFEELKKPSRFRGLYSDSSYTPDIDWIRRVENKERHTEFMVIEETYPKLMSEPYKKINF